VVKAGAKGGGGAAGGKRSRARPPPMTVMTVGTLIMVSCSIGPDISGRDMVGLV